MRILFLRPLSKHLDPILFLGSKFLIFRGYLIFGMCFRLQKKVLSPTFPTLNQIF